MTRIVSIEESELLLSERGHWFHQGEPFENEKVILFFHRAIRKDIEGRYFLYNRFEDKEENVYFEVEDTAYFVVDIAFNEENKVFVVVLNTGADEILDLHSLSEDDRGVMYCKVLDNDRARFSPWALMELSKHAEMNNKTISIDKTGEKIIISVET
ncbi:MAG: DUF1285 domain-containing protein [Deltaproteobacteria bacterium]|nr:DUF1285 domain-containing protein [Deltaproteobacteria bacterium]